MSIPKPSKLAALATCSMLAKDQRETATALGEAVRIARAAGCTWEEIAGTLGLERTNLYRQMQAGPRVAVIKPRRASPSAEPASGQAAREPG
jgi:hypothetical protein